MGYGNPIELSNGGTGAATAQGAYINLLAINTVNGTTVLDATNYGKTVIVTGSGNNQFTITLPPVSAGKTIRFIFNLTPPALAFLTPSSGTISGQASVGYGANEGCEVYCDGANSIIINQYLQPVSVLAFNSTTQSLTRNVSNRVTLDSVVYDIGNFMDTSTHIYTPRYPGKYLFTSAALFQSATTFGANLNCNNKFVKGNNPSGTNNYCLTISSPVVGSANVTVVSTAVIAIDGFFEDVFMDVNPTATGDSVLGSGTWDSGSCCTFQAIRINNF